MDLGRDRHGFSVCDRTYITASSDTLTKIIRQSTFLPYRTKCVVLCQLLEQKDFQKD